MGMERRWPNSVTFRFHLVVQPNSFEYYGHSAVDDYAPDSMELLPAKIPDRQEKTKQNINKSEQFAFRCSIGRIKRMIERK